MLTPSARKSAPRLRLEALEDRWVPATLFVDDGGSAKYHTISAAVAAADPGDKILVLPGRYKESVTVTDDHVSLRSVVPLAAVIDPPTAVQATVRIQGAEGVEVRGFTIRGQAQFGVQVDEDGSAEVRDNLIAGTAAGRLDYGVFVGGLVAAGSTGGSAEVTGNVVRNYESAGVAVVDTGSDATVTRNVITGVGPTDRVLQYGVVVAFGATGVVSFNAISKNNFTPVGDGTEAAGVYAVESGDVVIGHNALFQNEDGVLVEDNRGAVTVTSNAVFSNTRDGIVLAGIVGVKGAVVEHNEASCNGRDGIVVVGAGSTGNRIAQNDATGNGRNGLRVAAGASGNTITKNDLRGNDGLDAFDFSGGAANAWSKNKFKDGNIVVGG